MKKKLLLVFACFAASIAVLTGCKDKTTTAAKGTTSQTVTTQKQTTEKKTTQKVTTADPDAKYKITEEEFKEFFNPKNLNDIKKYNFTVTKEFKEKDLIPYEFVIKFDKGKISIKYPDESVNATELTEEEGKIIEFGDAFTIDAFMALELFPYVDYSKIEFDATDKTYKVSGEVNYEYDYMVSRHCACKASNIVFSLENGLLKTISFDIVENEIVDEEIVETYECTKTLTFSDFGTTTLDEATKPSIPIFEVVK